MISVRVLLLLLDVHQQLTKSNQLFKHTLNLTKIQQGAITLHNSTTKMTTSLAPSSQSLLSSCCIPARSAERVSLSKRRPLPSSCGSEKKGCLSEMTQFQSLPIQFQDMRAEPVTISLCGSPVHKSLSSDFEASPLTACSYQTMQQEYDRDTWRMYERIQSARTSQEQRVSFVEDRAVLVQSVNPNDIDEYYYEDDPPLLTEVDDDESEGIFEFDL